MSPRRRRSGGTEAERFGSGEGMGPDMTRIARSAALRLGYLPGMQTVEVPAAPATELPDPERNAVRADGGELAAVLGEGPEVTEPSHRLTDLPSGVIGDVLHGELTFEQAMAAAALRQATEEEQ